MILEDERFLIQIQAYFIVPAALELEPHSAVTGAWKRRRCRQHRDKTNDTHSRALQKHLSGYVGSYWPIESTQQCLPESLKKRTSKYSETQFLDFCFHRGAYKGVHFRSTAAKCCEANHFLSQTFFPFVFIHFFKKF